MIIFFKCLFENFILHTFIIFISFPQLLPEPTLSLLIQHHVLSVPYNKSKGKSHAHTKTKKKHEYQFVLANYSWVYSYVCVFAHTFVCRNVRTLMLWYMGRCHRTTWVLATLSETGFSWCSLQHTKTNLPELPTAALSLPSISPWES